MNLNLQLSPITQSCALITARGATVCGMRHSTFTERKNTMTNRDSFDSPNAFATDHVVSMSYTPPWSRLQKHACKKRYKYMSLDVCRKAVTPLFILGTRRKNSACTAEPLSKPCTNTFILKEVKNAIQ